MCGLLALFGLAPTTTVQLSHIDTARDIMSARGPDAAATISFADRSGRQNFMAHRRLAIQDLSDAATQPMRSTSGRTSIVYNGEIYNAPHLRQCLIDKGRVFRTHSDTEVLLEGYEVWGPDMINKIHGMFAFALYGHGTDTAFICRDRLGIKPLYIARTAGSLACASDARALTALGYGATIDQDALALYLMLGYVPAPKSIYTGIEKLEPGTAMLWQAGEVLRTYKYWTAPDATDYATPAQPLEDLIDEIVEENLLSDVPLGVFLSGGLDSSIVAASIAGLGKSYAQNMAAFTIAYPGRPTFDEAPAAQKTAAKLGFELRTLALSDVADVDYVAASAAFDEPLGYSAQVSQYAISKFAADHGLKVVLSGDGGDEIFSGYRWHLPANIGDFAPPRPLSMTSLYYVFKKGGRKKLQDISKGHKFRSLSDMFFYAFRVFSALRPDQIAELIPDLSQAQCQDLLHAALSRHDAPRLPDKRRLQRIDLYTFCPDAVLSKVDRTGMAHSLEIRPPLMDHRLADWGLSRPVDDANDMQPKNQLREILKRRGLGFLVDEPKRGFSLKLKSGPGSEQINSEIDRGLASFGIRPDWQTVISRYSESHSTKFNTLYYLSLWKQNGFRQSAPPEHEAAPTLTDEKLPVPA